jgi:Fic family protein
MAFIRKKRVGGRIYYLLVESYRKDGKVRQRTLRNFHNANEMLEYCKANGIRPPEIEIIDGLLAGRIEKMLDRLNSMRPLNRDSLESLSKKFEVDMTYNSNAIEGNRLSLKETYLVLEKGLTIGGRSMVEHMEATNHREAILEMEKLVRKREITETDILNLHAIILDKIKQEWAGFYRNGQVAITMSKHRPPSHRDVPAMMGEVVALINKREKGAPAIILAAQVHHKLVHIHPFWDGNGRFARLLMNIVLMRAGFPPTVLRKKERKSYYDALEAADAGSIGPLATMIARDVERSLSLYLETLS